MNTTITQHCNECGHQWQPSDLSKLPEECPECPNQIGIPKHKIEEVLEAVRTILKGYDETPVNIRIRTMRGLSPNPEKTGNNHLMASIYIRWKMVAKETPEGTTSAGAVSAFVDLE